VLAPSVSKVKLLLILGAILMIVPSLYVSLTSVTITEEASRLAYILKPGSTVQSQVKVSYPDTVIRIIIVSEDAEKTIIVSVRAPNGVPVDERTVTGSSAITLTLQPNDQPYRILFYYPGPEGDYVGGASVRLEYSQPLYASPTAYPYLTVSAIGALILGYALALARNAPSGEGE